MTFLAVILTLIAIWAIAIKAMHSAETKGGRS